MMKQFERVGYEGYGFSGVPRTKAEKREEGSVSVTELSAPEGCFVEGP